MNDNISNSLEKFDVSIVIVNYNVKEFLYKCLQSIYNSETKLKIQTIVVDNNSQDGSIQFLESKFPEVNFIQSSENLGFSKANNIGFKNSNGKYILILNPDTIISKNTIDTMYNYMESNPKVGISGCKVLNRDGTFQETCRRGFPTPWASFCKLFGLQKLFPNSKLFSQYNQTYRSIDETYSIDAVIGAFMFSRKEVIDKLSGFDESFFMYGEDIDLCFRTKKIGFDVTYFPGTSIIHFKGESTKRSNINDLFHFYNAMEIFVKKHYQSSSKLFLILLKLGINFRAFLASINKYKKDFFYLTLDLLFIFLTLLIATKFRFGSYFGFPEYAYPNVFIYLTIIHLFSMVSIGGYFEYNYSISKFSFGILGNFFMLSVLMYFFNDYAFSRGVLLAMIGGTLSLGILFRILMISWEKIFGKEFYRRIIVVGEDNFSEKVISILNESNSSKFEIIGKVSVKLDDKNDNELLVLGNIKHLSKLILENDINEVIFSDKRLTHSDIIESIHNTSINNVRYHIANDDNEFLISNIINEIIENNYIIPKYKLNYLRYKIFKRTFDILISTASLIFVFLFGLFSKDIRKKIENLLSVLVGERSIVGLFPSSQIQNNFKYGLTGLVQISKNHDLTENAIEKLNAFYLENYSISLDFDIIIKHLFRKKSGN